MGAKRPLVFIVGGLLAALFVVGLAVAGGAAPQGGPRCGAPWEAPGFGVPARLHVMPNVVCMDLQLAQDKLQAAAFDNVRSRDAAGGRNQFDDTDWVVTAQDPPPGRRAETNTPVMLTALRYGDSGAPPIPDRSRPSPIPNLKCFDLQEAQDTLQSAGFTAVDSEDASGARRNQWIDRNWTVVGQRPGPGPAVSKGTEIILRALKDDEPINCPQ